MPADSLVYAGSEMPSFFSLMLRLLLMVLLLGGALYGLKQLRKRMNAPGVREERSLEILSAISLGARRQAVLLRVSGRVLLLGLGEGGVRTLGRFSGSEADELIARAGQGTHPFQLRFLDALTRTESSTRPEGASGGASAADSAAADSAAADSAARPQSS